MGLKEAEEALTALRQNWQAEKIRMSKNLIVLEEKIGILTRQHNQAEEKNAELQRAKAANELKLRAQQKRVRELNRAVANLGGEGKVEEADEHPSEHGEETAEKKERGK